MILLTIMGFLSMLGIMGAAAAEAYFGSDPAHILFPVSGWLLFSVFGSREKLVKNIRGRRRHLVFWGMPWLVIVICGLASLLLAKLSGASFFVLLGMGIVAFTLAPAYEMGERLNELKRQGGVDSVPLRETGPKA